MLEHAHVPRPPARTVIVGAGGFVGAAIAAALEGRGATFLGLGRAEVDLLAPGAGAALAGRLDPGDTVVLVSALAPVKNAAMLRDNIRMIEAMAEAVAAATPAHVLNIGSDAVFADSDAPLTEGSCRAPGSLHGIMHLTREVMFAEAQGERPFATLRPTLIYGADDPHNGYGPNRFRRLAEAGEPIKLFGKGEERRDHIRVEDVAELAARIVLHGSSGSLNAVTGEVISFHDIAEEVSRLHGPVDIEYLPRSGPMPHNGYRPFDASAIAAAFPDFRPLGPREGLALLAR